MRAHTAELKAVGKRFGSTIAVRETTIAFRPGVITGLVGPNSCGKTTMLGLLAGRLLPTTGEVIVGGGSVTRDSAIATTTCMVGDGNELLLMSPIRKTLRLFESLRPDWNHDLAMALCEEYELSLNKRVSELSLGKKSALSAVIGLASQAPLTIFDEVTVGMDAATRESFCRHLLASYSDRPRTILVASHLVDELGRTFEDIVMMKAGEIIHHGPVVDLLDTLCEVTGRADVIESVRGQAAVLHTEQLGPDVRVILHHNSPTARDSFWHSAETAGLRVTDVPQQAAMLAYTSASPKAVA